MDSWWELGEGMGQSGNDLALYQIECAFCREKGNWGRVFHKEKKKPNGSKVLNFDVLQCGNCAGYVMAMWSATEYGGGRTLHDYRVLPWPLGVPEAPKHWPPDIQRYWLQTRKSLRSESWDAAAEMARSTMQLALRHHGAKGGNIKSEINDLADKGILPPLMKNWSHELRVLANESVHPEPDQPPPSPKDVRDVAKFVDYLLTYLFDLPKEIEEYRARRAEKT